MQVFIVSWASLTEVFCDFSESSDSGITIMKVKAYIFVPYAIFH
jgi:hypothetical protein